MSGLKMNDQMSKYVSCFISANSSPDLVGSFDWHHLICKELNKTIDSQKTIVKYLIQYAP